jgi:MSHA biogenesis protein MshL
VKTSGLLCVCLALAPPAHAQPPQAGAQGRGQLPPLPLTQLDDRAVAADLDKHTLTLAFSQPVLMRDLLMMLVRGTALSIVPGPEAIGSFTGELKNVTVREALELVLPPFGLDYSVWGSFIRVFAREPETRIFDINSLAGDRAATISVGGADPGGSSSRIVTTTRADLFADITSGVQTLLSERAAFNVDRKAGLLQVTDFPERLERVSEYLDTVHTRIHRQVQLDARVIEVELNDAQAESLDWAALGRVAQRSSGDGQVTPGRVEEGLVGRLGTGDVPRFLAALALQGRVSVLAAPRLLALNNEPAIVRAATATRGDGQRDARDEGIMLTVTPQISSDGIVTLGVSPIVTRHAGNSGQRPTVQSTRESDVVGRIADGDTLIVGGLTRDTGAGRTARAGGGWFGRTSVAARKRVELVILLTPTILAPPRTQ